MSERDTVATASMNQLPESDDITARSPLSNSKAIQTEAIALCEKALLTHIVLRGNSRQSAFADGVQKALGINLPETLQSHQANDRTLLWLSPDEWLLIAPKEQAFSLESALRQALSGQHYSVVNVSGGQTLIGLSGKQAQSVLKKSTPYDVGDRNFPVGKVVSTTFAKAQAVIYRAEDATWHLIVRRSFADYIWLWLSDASTEFTLCHER